MPTDVRGCVRRGSSSRASAASTRWVPLGGTLPPQADPAWLLCLQAWLGPMGVLPEAAPGSAGQRPACVLRETCRVKKLPHQLPPWLLECIPPCASGCESNSPLPEQLPVGQGSGQGAPCASEASHCHPPVWLSASVERVCVPSHCLAPGTFWKAVRAEPVGQQPTVFYSVCLCLLP